MNTAVIGLGSNIDPEINIAKARGLLKERFRVIAESKFVRTKPIGYTAQDDFINGSVYLETPLGFEELTKLLKGMEQEMGRRQAGFKSGPRSIDLDIVIFNHKVTDKDFYERDFLKSAALELIPDLEY